MMLAEPLFADLGLPLAPAAIVCSSPRCSTELRRLRALIATARKAGR